MNKNNFTLLLILLFLLSSFSRFDMVIPESEDQSDTIIYALPYDFDEYSVYTANSYATAQWNSAVYASLIKRSSNMYDWSPDLAVEMPSVEDGGLKYTFQLKPDLKFSNGHELTTEDIEFSFKVALTPKINNAFYGSYIGFFNNDSINVISETDIEFTLLKSFSFPYALLSFPIIDEQYFNNKYESCIEGNNIDCLWNDANGTDILSAGPFMVEDINNIHEIVTVKANPYYYDQSKVFTDKIVFQKIAEKDSAISALVSGTVDILDSQYVPGVDELKDLDGIHEEFSGEFSHQEFALNNLNPYFGTGELIPGNEAEDRFERYTDAVLVRKAMSHIVDRVYNVEVIMEGLGTPAATVMPRSTIGFDETLIAHEYSLTKARTLMEEAGFNYTTLGTENNESIFENSFFEITLMSPNSGGSGWRTRWHDIYVNELPKIGISVKDHVSTGWGEITPRTFGYGIEDRYYVYPGQDFEKFPLPPSYEDGGYDILSIGYGWSIDWNPGSLYDASGRCDIGDCGNFYNFDVDEDLSDVATLIREYLGELDFYTKIEKVKAVQQELYNHEPVIPILFPTNHWGWDENIEGLDPLLISISEQDWSEVKKDDFTSNIPTFGDGKESSELAANFQFNPIYILFVVIFSYQIKRRNYKGRVAFEQD